MLENIAEVSRKQIYETVSRMETHLNLFVGISGGGTEVEEEEGREIEIVSAARNALVVVWVHQS
jgi:hypothetical protein